MPCSPGRLRAADDLGGYYAAVAAAAGGRAVLAYHVPWISSPGVPVAALPALPVAGIKDSSGSPDRLLDELAHYQGATYVGSSALLAMAGPMGAAGAILALANVEPEDCCRAFAGDAMAQLALADRHLEVGDGGPSGAEAHPRQDAADVRRFPRRLTGASPGRRGSSGHRGAAVRAHS